MPVYEFPKSGIRHIHALLEDPYTRDLWICTGDHDHESFLARSVDGGRSFETVGTGSQTWRACCVLFTKNYIYWGADTSKYVAHRYIYRLRRGLVTPEQLQAVDGAVEFGVQLSDDLLAFSTSRTGYEDSSDPAPRLWLGRDEEWWSTPLGQWTEAPSGVAGKAHLCASREGTDLAISLLNLRPHNLGLLIATREAIDKALESSVSPSYGETANS